MKYYHPFIENNYYHVVSRAIGNEKLFTDPENYRFFLERFGKYISPVAHVYAYSLLPNHFHFLIKIKTAEEILCVRNGHPGEDGWIQNVVMQQFSNLLNSYTKSFNKRNQRKGALFMDYLRRVPVTSDHQFTATLFYIHKNAVHHGYSKEMTEWRYSSYPTLLSASPTRLMRDEVINWFGNLDAMVKYHAQPVYLKQAVVVE